MSGHLTVGDLHFDQEWQTDGRLWFFISYADREAGTSFVFTAEQVKNLVLHLAEAIAPSGDPDETDADREWTEAHNDVVGGLHERGLL